MECVHIAHDCIIGSGEIIGNSTKFAGEVTVEDNAIISANILCHQFCRIGGYVMIQGGSRFSMDIPPYIIVGKEPARYMGINLIGLRRRGFSNDQIEHHSEVSSSKNSPQKEGMPNGNQFGIAQIRLSTPATAYQHLPHPPLEGTRGRHQHLERKDSHRHYRPYRSRQDRSDTAHRRTLRRASHQCGFPSDIL